MARSGYERRLIRIPAGSDRAYDESEWLDELVIVVCGTLELEGLSGRRWAFQRGSILWLQDLPLRALHNPGDQPAILMTVSRPMNSRPPDRQS
jgi:hypothetical protein